VRTVIRPLLAIACLAIAQPVLATPSAGVAVEALPAPPSPAPTKVRLALSPAAASFMTDLRVRSLLDVELAALVPLAEESVGPLDEPAVRVFIDQPEGASLVIQVQAPGRPITRRRVDVTGLTWDVAARFAAIATAEIVRAELQPVRTRKPKARKPTPEELERADQARSRVRIAAGGASFVAWEGPIAAGPELSIGHTTLWVDVDLAARAAFGDGDTRVGAFETWLTLAHTMHVSAWIRLEVGGGIGAGTMSLVSDVDDDADGFGHAAGRIGVGARIAPETWIALRVEPGTLIAGPSAAAGARPFEGGVLGLALSIERSTPIEDAKPPVKAR
jgi:hypothetical protein